MCILISHVKSQFYRFRHSLCAVYRIKQVVICACEFQAEYMCMECVQANFPPKSGEIWTNVELSNAKN